jgi:hypothetical protein
VLRLAQPFPNPHGNVLEAALKDTEKPEAYADLQQGFLRTSERPPRTERHWRLQDHEASHVLHFGFRNSW